MCNNSLCSYCGIAKEVFKNGEFEEHFQEHLGKQYHCEHCMKTFKTKHKLSEHIRQLHKRHHTCEICTKVCTTESNLKQHIQIVHNNQDKLFCKLCDKTFSNKSNLKKHQNFIKTSEVIHYSYNKYSCCLQQVSSN